MDVFEKMGLPIGCRVDKVIYKKMFYESISMSQADKNLFKDSIEKIVWKYCLKTDNTNIMAYKDGIHDYPELEIINVELREEKRMARIADIVMRAIPYPMMLLFVLNNSYQIWVAQQRVSQADQRKTTIDSVLHTDWLEIDDSIWEKLALTRQNSRDFFALYTGIYDAISLDLVERKVNAPMDNHVSGEEARALLLQIDKIDQELVDLRRQLKKETQFNRKLETNMKIKTLQAQRLALTNGKL